MQAKLWRGGERGIFFSLGNNIKIESLKDTKFEGKNAVFKIMNHFWVKMSVLMKIKLKNSITNKPK
jgi:hypothetical protein